MDNSGCSNLTGGPAHLGVLLVVVGLGLGGGRHLALLGVEAGLDDGHGLEDGGDLVGAEVEARLVQVLGFPQLVRVLGRERAVPLITVAVAVRVDEGAELVLVGDGQLDERGRGEHRAVDLGTVDWTLLRPIVVLFLRVVANLRLFPVKQGFTAPKAVTDGLSKSILGIQICLCVCGWRLGRGRGCGAARGLLVLEPADAAAQVVDEVEGVVEVRLVLLRLRHVGRVLAREARRAVRPVVLEVRRRLHRDRRLDLLRRRERGLGEHVGGHLVVVHRGLGVEDALLGVAVLWDK